MSSESDGSNPRDKQHRKASVGEGAKEGPEAKGASYGRVGLKREKKRESIRRG